MLVGAPSPFQVGLSPQFLVHSCRQLTGVILSAQVGHDHQTIQTSTDLLEENMSIATI
jgi:hypothetical protein